MEYRKIQTKLIPIAAVSGCLLMVIGNKINLITDAVFKNGILVFLGIVFIGLAGISLITGESNSKGLMIRRESSSILFYISVAVDLVLAITFFTIAVNH